MTARGLFLIIAAVGTLGLAPVVAGWVAGAPTRTTRPARPATAGADPSAVDPALARPVPDTPVGAASFASAVVQALGSERLLDAAYRHWVLEANTAPDQQAPLTDRVDLEMTSMDRQMAWSADVAAGRAVLMRTAVVGARVSAFSPAQATVQLWLVGVVGSDRSGVGEDWQVATVGVTYRDSRWMLDSLDTADGPAPDRGPARGSAPADLLAWSSSWPGGAVGSAGAVGATSPAAAGGADPGAAGATG